MGQRLDRIDANIERHSERLDRIDANIERLHNIVTSLTEFVLEFRQETAQHFEVLDNRLDVLTATLSNIEARFPTLTNAFPDFDKLATQLTN